MKKTFAVTIKNMLNKMRRDINIIHHCSTNSAHIISYNRSVTLSLNPTADDDYIQLSLVSVPRCPPIDHHIKIDMPAQLDFDFMHEGHFKHTGRDRRTHLWVPPGPHKWQLTITRPMDADSTTHTGADNIIISDEIRMKEKEC